MSAGAAPGPRLADRSLTRGRRAWYFYQLRRSLRPWQAAPLLLLAFLPALVILILAWAGKMQGKGAAAFVSSPGFYARLFDGLLLHTAIFFGCAWLFLQLIRGELTGRILHFAWLTPIRRSWLGWGKYFAGAALALVFFNFATLASSLLLLRARHAELDGHALAAYLGITSLACLGYGAVFFYMGARFRQPLFPALAFLGWEQIVFLLPPWLQRVSIIYYLHALHPGGIPAHAWGFVPPPMRALTAVLWLLAISGGLAWLGVRRFARLEVNYGNED